METHKAEKSVLYTVRTHDPDRYAASLFAPREARPGLMALYAFNADVARIAEIVSEPMLGEIRLQWWRDAIAGFAAGEASGNPVADALACAVREHGLPVPLLQGVLDARAFDISGEVMPDRQAFRVYLNKTAGALFILAARMLGGKTANADRAAEHAGFAYGLTGLMRALPLHAARGRTYLPVSHFLDHGAKPERLLKGEADAAAKKALEVLRQEASNTLNDARNAISELPARTKVAFLPLALVAPYLAALERRRHDPFSAVAEINPLARQWHLWRAALTGRV